MRDIGARSPQVAAYVEPMVAAPRAMQEQAAKPLSRRGGRGRTARLIHFGLSGDPQPALAGTAELPPPSCFFPPPSLGVSFASLSPLPRPPRRRPLRLLPCSPPAFSVTGSVDTGVDGAELCSAAAGAWPFAGAAAGAVVEAGVNAGAAAFFPWADPDPFLPISFRSMICTVACATDTGLAAIALARLPGSENST